MHLYGSAEVNQEFALDQKKRLLQKGSREATTYSWCGAAEIVMLWRLP